MRHPGRLDARTLLGTLGLVATAAAVAAPREPAQTTADATRAAVARALPVLAGGAEVWMAGEAPQQSSSCNSCHVVTFSAWAHLGAVRNGIAADRSEVDRVTRWSHEQLESVDEAAQLLLAVVPDARGADGGGVRATVDGLVDRILEGRDADGAWKGRGQLPYQKRPADETHGVTTMWALLALESAGAMPEPGELSALSTKLDEAVRDDAGIVAPRSTEWLALRAWLGRALDPAGYDGAMRRTLIDRQNDDGGWPWLHQGASDPIATGQVLYLASRLGLPPDDDRVGLAVAYLLRTQREDGSWLTLGTLERSRNEETWTSRYWGTAWAALGLLESLPVERATASR